MKKSGLRIAALCAALLLIFGLAAFANSLVGNPISKALASRTARQYIAQQYADTDYALDRIGYNFKDGNYYAHLKSPTSIDGDFALSLNGFGKLIYDNYADRVTSGENTANRLNAEYRALTDRVFDDPAFPYQSDIAFGKLVFYAEKAGFTPEITVEELELNRLYDVPALGREVGRLVVYVDCDTISEERMAEVLLDIRQRMELSGAPFRVIDLVLQYPRPEDGSPRAEGRLAVMDFAWEDITPDGLESRVAVAVAETERYYAEQDKK